MELQTISNDHLNASSQQPSPSQVTINEEGSRDSGVQSWLLDSYSSYRLSKESIDSFLTETFGDYDFGVTLLLDYFEFMVPRRLSEEERETLGKLRVSNRRRGRRSPRPSTPSQQGVAQQNPNSTLGGSFHNGITTIDCLPNTIPPQTCRTCGILVLFWIFIPLASVAIGFWRSFATGDEGKGFTDAAYVVAAGGMIMYPIQRFHNRKCILRRLDTE